MIEVFLLNLTDSLEEPGDPSGKPYLVDSTLQISLAHSKNWVACSVGEIASDVDVEEDSIDELTLAEFFFCGARI